MGAPCSFTPDQCLDEFDNFIVKQENFNSIENIWRLESCRPTSDEQMRRHQ
jgi:hypothetical protein